MSTTAESSQARATSLSQLLRGQAARTDIEAHLEALGPQERVAEMLDVRGRGVKALYEAVDGAPTMSLEELLPANEEGTRIYEGRNSLPLFSRFQKRFFRTESGLVIGYNHQSMSFATGPGYFVVKPASGEGPHGSELYFDYTDEPGIEPVGWPRFKPNDAGLSKLVYGNMIDYVRRVARGIIVGKAYKLGVEQDAYFSLTFAE